MIHDPYQVMGLDPDADGDQIRQRYLALVREYPPERAPERAAEVRAAYDILRDPVNNLDRRLFDLRPVDTFEALLADQRQELRRQRIPTDVLLSLGDP